MAAQIQFVNKHNVSTFGDAIGFSPNGKHFVSAGQEKGSDKGVIQIWKWKKGKLHCTSEFKIEEKVSSGISFTKNGAYALISEHLLDFKTNTIKKFAGKFISPSPPYHTVSHLKLHNTPCLFIKEDPWRKDDGDEAIFSKEHFVNTKRKTRFWHNILYQHPKFPKYFEPFYDSTDYYPSAFSPNGDFLFVISVEGLLFRWPTYQEEIPDSTLREKKSPNLIR